MLNVETSFLTENRSVYDFLNQPGQGLYIPLYQRDYSWDSDNIEQLLEDISRGIQRIANGEVTDDNKEIRFLGTIITVIENNRQNIYPVDPQAVPSKIEKIIDGQQRVSTITLMSTILLKRLLDIKARVKENNPLHNEICEICDIWDAKLKPLFCFDLQRGTPKLKPKVIRGAIDYWTRDRGVDEAYKSPLSNYLGNFIKAYCDGTALPIVPKQSEGNNLLHKNAKQIKNWLENDVAKAHINDNDDNFSRAEMILEHLSQDMIWEYDRPELVDIIRQADFSSNKKDSYILSELVQTIAVCHYLLDRCCFTIIQPTDDDWAFDMFQSLNATGTPLTAIETFKPTVVNTTDNEPGYQFKDSECEKYFKKVEDFLSKAPNAQQKNKWTNDFLTSFFVAYDGRTMSTHFSYQRKALDAAYNELPSFAQKEQFVKTFGNYAEFYSTWMSYTGVDGALFPRIVGLDADIASMIILMLKESNHKMAITVLGKMYEPVINGELQAVDRFVHSVKLIGSYFFLWRSAWPNSGLDTSYREFFKYLKNNGKSVDIYEIKRFIKESLAKKGITDYASWRSLALSYLRYANANNTIVRLALLAAAHDTQPDNGSIKEGRDGISPYLTLEKWISPDLRTIEHISPQSNVNDKWDTSLYTDAKEYQTLGNLTLLPQDINSSAGNRGWEEKQLYYECVSQTDSLVIDSIRNRALAKGFSLNEQTLELLKNCRYNKHIDSIAKKPDSIAWDSALVSRRTEDILSIAWKRLSFALD
ncbi:MAG: DUF262 domain-containing HNH endonuclease family protein [Bacteroidales bacterium]|nr:DUF262 domain-containing HNH endonuclease family protein [Bacteroidales bacterium]